MEIVTFTNGAVKLNIHMENKNELSPYITPYIYAKMNLRWIQNLNIKLKVCNFYKEKQRSLTDLQLEDF